MDFLNMQLLVRCLDHPFGMLMLWSSLHFAMRYRILPLSRDRKSNNSGGVNNGLFKNAVTCSMLGPPFWNANVVEQSPLCHEV